MTMILKSNGERTEFNANKIRETLQRAGVKPAVIDHVLAKTQAKLKDGMATRRVLAIVRKELHREDRCAAHRYNLRQGLLRLGPAGFKFEKYVASILTAYGYEAQVPDQEIPGLCVPHEIDVIASKDGKRVLIEAKFRNAFEDTVTLKDAMATWARFMDVNDGARTRKTAAYDELWIVTNGRFSDRAQQFCQCKDVRMVGWSETEHSLARMVDHQALYPITVIDDLKQWELDAFAKKGYMLCREIAEKDPGKIMKQTGIASERAERLVQDCRAIVSAN